MSLVKRCEAWAAVGSTLKNLSMQEKERLFYKASAENPWFTQTNLEIVISNWAENLSLENLLNFSKTYPVSQEQTHINVGLILAGNLPLVGLHDMLCVSLAGHKALIKSSSNDKVLVTFIIDLLNELAPEVGKNLVLIDKLTDHQAVIATGSNNSARYFESYFGHLPHIIRKNRTSLAIIDDTTTDEELMLLSDDIFAHFGMGCRNVGYLFLPENFPLERLAKSWEKWGEQLVQHNKYMNNYDYHKAIYLMEKIRHYDFGFFLFKEDQEKLFSPLANLHYSHASENEINEKLKLWSADIQVVIANTEKWKGAIPFGQAQKPGLSQFADNVDTLKFLTELVN